MSGLSNFRVDLGWGGIIAVRMGVVSKLPDLLVLVFRSGINYEKEQKEIRVFHSNINTALFGYRVKGAVFFCIL